MIVMITLVFSMILHSDISAGYSPSIFNAMRDAIHTSKALSLTINTTNYQPLTHHEAFYLATLGGAQGLPVWRMKNWYHTRSNYPNILIAQTAYLIINLPNSLNVLNFEFSYLFYLTPNGHVTRYTKVLKCSRMTTRS